MEEFCGMEDWGLQAVVRGSSVDFTNNINTGVDDQNSIFGIDQKFDHEFFFDFPEIFEAVNFSGDELEELYKPFYPAVTISVPAYQTVVEFKEETPANVVQEKHTDNSHSETSDSTTRATAYTPKYKRRKNQHKRVVVQVSAEGLSSDVWAWRKYGQKPIKGSPYPRSYYRCSSSKGCLARKQVEQSCTDPGMFIITYTAEHSHSKPTRRNSLAGTIRQKFPATKSPNYRSNIKKEKTEDYISDSRISAPETVLTSPVEEEFLQAKCNQEGKEDDELIFSDDFFSGLEEFDGFNFEILSISCHSSASTTISFEFLLILEDPEQKLAFKNITCERILIVIHTATSICRASPTFCYSLISSLMHKCYNFKEAYTVYRLYVNTLVLEIL